MSTVSTPFRISDQRTEKAKFRSLVTGVFLLALVVRLAFFLNARVDYPIRGDIVQYVNYAWNMLNNATFSSAPPGSAPVHPHAFRGPGYPMFLALWIWLTGEGRYWYFTAVMAQILVGASLAPLSIAWARLWLPRSASVVVGFLVALWPHAVVLSSTLLS